VHGEDIGLFRRQEINILQIINFFSKNHFINKNLKCSKVRAHTLLCKNNMLQICMQQKHISTNEVSSMKLRSKKLETLKSCRRGGGKNQTDSHEFEQSPSKDSAMHERDNH
jgi:hypothetical protein